MLSTRKSLSNCHCVFIIRNPYSALDSLKRGREIRKEKILHPINLSQTLCHYNFFWNNKNDIIDLIGSPSTKSDFNKNKWFYIERRKTNQSLFKLGQKKIEKNNILMVEFNNRGILKNKIIFDIDDMNEIKYVKSLTQKEFKQNNFLYNIFSSFREKINAPSRNRSKNK